jgi:hypothetical protein
MHTVPEVLAARDILEAIAAVRRALDWLAASSALDLRAKLGRLELDLDAAHAMASVHLDVPPRRLSTARARDVLADMGACDEALAWVGERTAAEAWLECPRADWLLWYAARVGVDRRRIVLAACDCARSVLPLVPSGEDRPRLAIEAAERWASSIASDVAYSVAAYSVAAYSAAAAYVAAYAAASAASDAYAAALAASAAAAASASDSASQAQAAQAYASAALRCADLVRARIGAAWI